MSLFNAFNFVEMVGNYFPAHKTNTFFFKSWNNEYGFAYEKKWERIFVGSWLGAGVMCMRKKEGKKVAYYLKS